MRHSSLPSSLCGIPLRLCVFAGDLFSMTTWFTADTHFGHANIIKYCARPFLTPQERERALTDARGKWRVSDDTVRRHDDGLLDAINARVEVDDILWILGDYCWGRLDEAARYRERIACRNVHLVWGNHDHRSIEPVFSSCIEQGMLTIEGQHIWLNHYPMRSWDGRFHGRWQLYGHVHGRLVAQDESNLAMLTRDVGVDACDYRPLSFDDLSRYMHPRIEVFDAVKASGASVD